ncbi:MAG: ABC transporter ATP-binding protein [Oscillospiraceae bacterium]|nr:MAG: ABC transporter ATP-binding protein [Clostridia bacterium]
MAFLELTHVEAFYGKIRALKGIDLNVEQGEIVTLIGANGAGKSTTLKAISGLMKLGPEAKITFDGEDITHLPPHEIAARGIAHVPEGRGIFAENTVLENLRMGAYLSRSKARTQELLETSLDLFPRLRERLRQQAGTLSGGEQQMLTMARGLMMEPKLMLLDEPSMGLAPVIVEQIFEIIADLHRRGITILLVEQNARMALQIAQRGYVIQTGRIALTDASERLQNDPVVQGLYLGEA